MKKTLLLIVLLLSRPSLGSNNAVVLNIGVGSGIMKGPGTPFERSFQLGFEHWLAPGLFVRPQAGYFLDVSGENKSSFTASGLIGVAAKSPMGAVLHLAFGPMWLQNTDNLLGGHFQFNLEGGIGIYGENVGIEAVWWHFSSAGIYQPNKGRDFPGVQVKYFLP